MCTRLSDIAGSRAANIAGFITTITTPLAFGAVGVLTKVVTTGREDIIDRIHVIVRMMIGQGDEIEMDVGRLGRNHRHPGDDDMNMMLMIMTMVGEAEVATAAIDVAIIIITKINSTTTTIATISSKLL